MKLFWKIFYSVVLVTTVLFCISGHILLGEFFRTTLDEEINAGVNLNTIYNTSIKTAVTKSYGDMSLPSSYIARIVAGVQIQAVDEITEAEVTDAKGNIVYEKSFTYTEKKRSSSENGQKEIKRWQRNLYEQATDQRAAYEIREEDGNYYIATASVVTIGDEAYYVNTIKDVTSLFTQQKVQYRIFTVSLLVFLFGTMLVTAVLSGWITHPLRRLTQTARKIGEGQYELRAQENEKDEIGELAAEFNNMTEKLVQNMQELQEAATRQEDFVGSFSHELKTPLTSIIGYSDMLRSRPVTEEERMIYADYIYRQGKRLENLSKKMLELIVLRRGEFQMREIFLDELLDEICGEMRPVLEKKKILLEVFCENLHVTGEADLLKTVILNLIDNSVKAIEGKKEPDYKGKIRICGTESPDEILLTVEDNGKGIPGEEIHRVTESFYMVDKSRKHENGNAGLGLSICQRVLELHHAELILESQVGEGTRAKILFRRDEG